jgi:hypothetical protein
LLLNWATKAELMEEKRKHLRTEINEPAYVSSGGSVMGCVVRNIPVEAPPSMSRTRRLFPSAFAWSWRTTHRSANAELPGSRKSRIGLTFVDTL